MLLVMNGTFAVLWAALAFYCLYVINSPLALLFSLAGIANVAIIVREVTSSYSPPREYWLNVFTSSYSVAFPSRATADAQACDRKECILVREVKL